MKKFEVVCAPYGMDFLGIKWADKSEREFDAEMLKSGVYSERYINNLFDDFYDGFNHICKDEKGEYYAVSFDSDKRPLVWRRVEPVVEVIPEITLSSYIYGREAEWGEFECAHGYGVFNGDYPATNGDYGYIKGDHIEVIDEMAVDKSFWESDIEAAKHYEEHEEVKIIRDIPGIDAVFIDTPENRKKITEQLERLKPSLSDTLAAAVDRSNKDISGFSNQIVKEKEMN